MQEKKLPAVLSIAGSDCSGGAGIQADLKTIQSHGLYGMSVVTAVTAQNTCGVFDVEMVSERNLRAQLEAVFTDIVPDSVKIGMLGSQDTVEIVADALEKYRPKKVVLDTVMLSTSGHTLLDDAAKQRMTERLFPLVSLVTPNIPEMEVLTALPVRCSREMEESAKCFWEKYRIPVLVKGGHAAGGADDVLWDGEKLYWYREDRIESSNTHGTGCTLSSAIASRLALGCGLPQAVALGKAYVRGAIAAGLNLGRGNGPLYHDWNR